jgi:hypothetical protein
MTTNELLDIVKSRGLKIVLIDGRPVLEGARGNPAVTDNLLSVLRIHRDRIKEGLERESASKG